MTKNMEITDVLRELEPTVESLLNRHLNLTKVWYPHQYVPYSDGESFGRKNNRGEVELAGKEWDPIDSKLGEVAQIAWYVNLLTEDNLPSYHHEIATKFGRDGAWGTWVHRWTAEENRHGVAMREFAHVTRAIDPVELEDTRMHHMGHGYNSGDKTPLEAVAYVTMQELATRIAHRNTGEICKQEGNVPAEQLLARISADENLHMIFYRDLGKAALDIAPNLMMRAIANEVVGFKMPGDTIPNFKEHSRKIADAGIYDLQLHVDDVLEPTFKKWQIFEREDLTGDGAVARDEIGFALELIKGAASKFVTKREARREAAKAVEEH